MNQWELVLSLNRIELSRKDSGIQLLPHFALGLFANGHCQETQEKSVLASAFHIYTEADIW